MFLASIAWRAFLIKVRSLDLTSTFRALCFKLCRCLLMTDGWTANGFLLKGAFFIPSAGLTVNASGEIGRQRLPGWAHVLLLRSHGFKAHENFRPKLTQKNRTGLHGAEFLRSISQGTTAKLFPRIVCWMSLAASRTGMRSSLGADLALDRRRPNAFPAVLKKRRKQ